MTTGSNILLTHHLDNRHYLYSQLENGLKVILVEDQTSETCSVAATIGNGHFSDPADCLGLSHLLEHVLFQGNKKYKTVDAFDTFLSLHGGTVNAATGSEYSHYYFSVNNENLSTALDHFSHLLTQPLFEIESIKKEISAIDAEFSLKINDDLRRLYEVHKETSNPEHPFSQFSVGNASTLNTLSLKEVQQRLFALHQNQYVSHNMTLCIISPFDTQTCLELVKAHFGSFANRQAPHAAPLPALYLDEQLGIRIDIAPLKSARRLIVTFALPSMQHLYRTKPLCIISELLADEGPDGLLGHFKAKGFATNISVGGGIEGSNFRDFNVNLQLTEAGLANIDLMLETIFQYIEHIKQHNKIRYFDEKSTLLSQIWQFADAIKPTDEAISLSSSIFIYPPEHLIASEYILDKPNPAVVDEVLNFFTPENMRVKVVSPNPKTTFVSRWYQTPYNVSAIPSSLMQKLQNASCNPLLKLPEKNPFLSRNHSRIATDAQFIIPQQTFDTADFNVWFGQDNQFELPRGDCYVSFDCQAATLGVEAAATKKLWIALLNNHFQQRYYQANVAGLNYHLYSHQCGFSLHTSGFSANQLMFAHELTEQIHTFEDFNKHFEQVKHQQLQSLHNNLLNKPINRLFTRLSALMQQNTHTPLSMVNAIEKASIEQVYEVKSQMLNNRYIESLIFGNWHKTEAEQFSSSLYKQHQKFTGHGKLSRSVFDLSQQRSLLHSLPCNHPDAAVVIYYQSPNAKRRDTLLTILLEQLVSPVFFNFARQQAQLGYLVGSGYVPFNQHPGMAFYVQSPQYSAEYLIKTIRDFLQKFTVDLQQYQKNWNDIKQGVMKQLCQNDANLSMKSQRLWSALGNRDYAFSQNKDTANELTNIEFSDLMTFVKGLVIGKNTGELILYSDPNHKISASELSVAQVTDVSEFKKHTPLVE
ncbi:insulinase family protein [Paraglaciecola chathamensis]|uniref:Protease 3 n=1 Tax=Paraglaciecola chathamensis S18K6 TaxID=1127672 RepID=A0AAV3USW0_9ALTE|nr:insulinase family protein [Paraglaciecola chathamensis]GAC08058.1 peptidase M16-like [Paraglaciecola chathamensis S18K6]